MNVYDSNQFTNMLFFYGYEMTEDIDKADIIIANTCTVRKKAEEKVYSFIGRIIELKKRNPKLIVCLTGCLAQQEGESLFKRFNVLNIVLGVDVIYKLLDYIKKIEKDGGKIVDIENLSKIPEIKNIKIKETSPTAFVTIMQGCDNFCSYCIVPYVRGREKSKHYNSVLGEIKTLVERGSKEITLLGQNVNSYGKKEGFCLFDELLYKIEPIEDLERIRFATSHPKDMSDGLIKAFKNIKKLCKHIHLPVQSGSDNVLKKMNRAYLINDYLEKIEKIKKIDDRISITTDLIVGFPGETEKDFQKTVSLIKEVEYDNIFAFIYSDRKDTKASRFENKIEKEEKKARINELLKVQKAITQKKNNLYIGKTEKILCEGISKRKNQFTGRTDTNKVVNFEHINDDIVGKIVDIKITKAMSNSLLGDVV